VKRNVLKKTVAREGKVRSWERFRAWNNRYFLHLSPSLSRATLRSSISVLIVALALSAIVLPSLCAMAHAVSSYQVGVKTGEVAYYELTGSYGFFPSQPETQMTVQSVAGTNITAGFTSFFPDGLLSSNVYWVDVFTGQVRNVSSNMFFAVTPGLQLYDKIFNNANLTITSHQAILCGGTVRQVVTAQFSKTSQNVAIGWDQSTGALCRLQSQDQFQPSRYLSMEMKNTTIWGASSNPPDVFAIASDITAFLGLPLVALIVFVYFRRRRARKKVGPS